MKIFPHGIALNTAEFGSRLEQLFKASVVLASTGALVGARSVLGRPVEWNWLLFAMIVTMLLAGFLSAAWARTTIAIFVEKEPLRDRLTGLPNRAWMCHRLDEALAQVQSRGVCTPALLLLSLDRLRVITNSLGCDAGDRLLIDAAKRIRDKLGAGEVAARVGDEEFAILLKGPRDLANAIHFAEHLQAELGSAYRLQNHEVYTTASIGIALCSASYRQSPEVLRDAETANHDAVARGGASIEIFEPRLRDRAVALFDMENMLRQAVLKDGNFEVHYQPIVDLESGSLTGFEALVRLRRADGMLVPPAEFIPLTEETGLIVRIGHWVLAEACRQMRAWQGQFPDCPPLKISVNLAGRQFRQPELVREIEQVLADTGLDAASLKLEVTETVLMEHAEEAAGALARLRAKGIELLIDDFGTGYSSLSHLCRFPLDTLKIDASFVRKMSASQKDADILASIVTLAHTLGMKTIAEGVETGEQMAQLRKLDVGCGQGYHFAKPLDRAAAEALIANWPRWSS